MLFYCLIITQDAKTSTSQKWLKLIVTNLLCNSGQQYSKDIGTCGSADIHSVDVIDALKSLLLYFVLLQAISNALDEELQEMAWKAVVPLVGKLKSFYEYALELGKWL